MSAGTKYEINAKYVGNAGGENNKVTINLSNRNIQDLDVLESNLDLLKTIEDFSMILEEFKEAINDSRLPQKIKKRTNREIQDAKPELQEAKINKEKVAEKLKNAREVLSGMGQTANEAVAFGNLLNKAIGYLFLL